MSETLTHFDYIIVGAGSAGCVLANRLSQDPDVTVLLLEAGPPDDRPDIRVPSRYGTFENTELDWAYVTVPEVACGNRRLMAPRGRTLGGSSSINAMIYMRGAASDFDDWGIPGWSWADLLPSFIGAEDNERGASEYHGVGGPLSVADGRSANQMMTAFVDAAIESGLPRNDDFNGTSQLGAGPFQLTQREGLRWSAANAYLHPVMHRDNLLVLTYATVDRIRFDGDRAIAVDTRQMGSSRTIWANREIILSAGTYATAHLLQLSGVGPADHLRSRGIDVVLDQPEVGSNLSDHPAVPLVWTTPERASIHDMEGPQAMAQYEKDRTGPMTSNLAEAGAFGRVAKGDGLADIQWHAVPLPIVDEGTEITEDGIWIAPCLLQPESRGTVRLATADPTRKPVIRCNYWDEPGDLQLMREGVRRTLDMVRQESLRPYCVTPLRAPGSEDDAALDFFIAQNTMTLFHASGTCALGVVVDAELRVKGVHGLRVVDGSILPIVPRGNPNAVIIAVAEHAAQIITGSLVPADHRSASRANAESGG